MTLYTVMPIEVVLEGAQHVPPATIELLHSGVRLQIKPLAPGAGEIVRLLEAGLDDYLRPELTPGQVIYW